MLCIFRLQIYDLYRSTDYAYISSVERNFTVVWTHAARLAKEVQSSQRICIN